MAVGVNGDPEIDKAVPVELIDRRTLSSKTFQLAPNRFQIQAGLGIAHVPQDFEAMKAGRPTAWDAPDLAIADVATDGTVALGKTYFDLTIPDRHVGFTYTSKLGGKVSVTLIELGGEKVADKFKPEQVGVDLWWSEVAPGVDIFLRVWASGVELFKKIKNEKAARSFTWQIDEDDPPLLRRQAVSSGVDNADFADAARRQSGVADHFLEMLHTQTAFESVGKGVRRTLMTETWTGRTFTLDSSPERRKIFSDSDIVYPVLIDVAVNEIIADSTINDGFDEGNWYNATPGAINWIGSRKPGFRFTTVAIPAGAAINSATLSLHTGGGGTGTFRTAKWYGYDTDNAAQWTPGATTITPQTMAKTSANTNFTLNKSPTGYHAIDVTAIVAEIVARAGWASGNAISIATPAPASAQDGSVYITDFSSGSGNYAKLDIDYTAAPTGVPIPVAMHHLKMMR